MLAAPFDAIAIGRWVAFWAMAVFATLAALLQRRGALAGGLAAGFAALFWLSTPQTAPPTTASDTVRVYTKNLLYKNRDLAAIEQDIRQTAPDLVFLQEISVHTKPLIASLSDLLPHSRICPFAGWNGMAILSNAPFDGAARCSPIRSLMAVRVRHDATPFWAVNAHLQHAWPDLQWPHLTLALPVLDAIRGPAIMAGDFNTMHWAHAPRLIGGRTATLPLTPNHATFTLAGFGLPLDQIWGASGQAQLRRKFSSDHNGLSAEVGLAPPE